MMASQVLSIGYRILPRPVALYTTMITKPLSRPAYGVDMERLVP
jgi:hypothetical protein